MAEDAIQMLKNDHRKVEQLFESLEISGGDRQRLVTQLIDELTVHAELEEQVVYPAIRQALPDGDAKVDHAEEEHSEVKQMLSELEGLDPASDEAMALVRSLKDSVTEHVEEEEGDVLPKFRDAADEAALQALSRKAAEFKQGAGAGGRGSAQGRDQLIDLTKDELYKMAQEQEIEGRSDMTKEQLIDALSKR